ncbi:hypothetical protein Mapa_002365 [Marchantia paleacea]|nr:hypothetical protein Mapa_002365 [Marchantia paleacea]
MARRWEWTTPAGLKVPTALHRMLCKSKDAMRPVYTSATKNLPPTTADVIQCRELLLRNSLGRLSQTSQDLEAES